MKTKFLSNLSYSRKEIQENFMNLMDHFLDKTTGPYQAFEIEYEKIISELVFDDKLCQKYSNGLFKRMAEFAYGNYDFLDAENDYTVKTLKKNTKIKKLIKKFNKK